MAVDTCTWFLLFGVTVTIVAGHVNDTHLELVGLTTNGLLNKDYTFKCVDNSSSLAIRWIKNNEEVAAITRLTCNTPTDNSDTRFEYNCNAKEYTLRIPGKIMTEELNGTKWSCRRLTGGTSNKKTLFIYEHPKTTTEGYQDHSVEEHSESTEGYPDHSVEEKSKVTDGYPDHSDSVKEHSKTTTAGNPDHSDQYKVSSEMGEVIWLYASIAAASVVCILFSVSCAVKLAGRCKRRQAENSGVSPDILQNHDDDGEGNIIVNELYASSGVMQMGIDGNERNNRGHSSRDNVLCGELDKVSESDSSDDHVDIVEFIGSPSFRKQKEKPIDVERKPLPFPRKIKESFL